jgi:hypothetical protein
MRKVIDSYYGTITLNGSGEGSVTLNNGNAIAGEIKALKIVGNSASATISVITSKGRTIFSKAAYDSTAGAQSFALMQPAYTSGFVATTAPAHVPQVLMGETVVVSVAAGTAGHVLRIYLGVG